MVQVRYIVVAALLALGAIPTIANLMEDPAAPSPGSDRPTAQGGQSAAPPSQTSGDPVEAEVGMADLTFSPAEITVPAGSTVTWVNDEAIGHTVTPTDKEMWGTEGSGDAPADWLGEGETWSFTFDTPGEYVYICIPHAYQDSDGEWQGMVAKVIVTGQGDQATPSDTGGAVDFVMPNETIVPDPVAPPLMEPDGDGIVRITLETVEKVAKLDDGTAYEFWTFDGTVPGPMLRVTEGDTVELTLSNPAYSTHPHNIDLHAVTGPGGGAEATLVNPGESATFRFEARNPGLFVYHCAAGHVPSHIANGMYGMILVEPKEGLEPVDREYYVVQGEVYTTEPMGYEGKQTFSMEKLKLEQPEYVLFNGQVGALTGDDALHAEVNETVRLFFGVGGGIPSSFHVIGEVFDHAYMDANPPATENRQTILVPAAGAVMVEFGVEYPGDYVLVDHTLTRTFDKGALGILHVEGDEDPTVFREV